MNAKMLVAPLLIGSCICSTSCQLKAKQEVKESVQITAVQKNEKIVTDKIRFCESTLPLGNNLLIANFGTEQLNPLNQEGKGYILSYSGNETAVLIPADGNLSAPKGMYNTGDYLFICDVNKVVVYNLKKIDEAPQIIQFPADDMFVNDLAAHGNTLYVSVTNTGRIYSLDISDLAGMSKVKPVLYTAVTGANGIIVDGNTMYVASYPADGTTTPENVIYYIPDLNKPIPEKFITEAGQYDGIALSADKQTLYVTNWLPAGVAKINMTSKKIEYISLDEKVVGPADISLVNTVLYIPDLPNSRVIVVSL